MARQMTRLHSMQVEQENVQVVPQPHNTQVQVQQPMQTSKPNWQDNTMNLQKNMQAHMQDMQTLQVMQQQTQQFIMSNNSNNHQMEQMSNQMHNLQQLTQTQQMVQAAHPAMQMHNSNTNLQTQAGVQIAMGRTQTNNMYNQPQHLSQQTQVALGGIAMPQQQMQTQQIINPLHQQTMATQATPTCIKGQASSPASTTTTIQPPKAIASGRKAGLALYIILTVLAIGFTVSTIFVPIFMTLWLRFYIIFLAGAGVLIINTIYYICIFAVNRCPTKLSKGASVFDILLFPLFGFPRLFFTALERNDKRRSSNYSFSKIRKTYKTVQDSASQLDVVMIERSNQASMWQCANSQVLPTSPKVLEAVTSVENSVADFITVYSVHKNHLHFDNASMVREWLYAAEEAKIKTYQAKDTELFFAKFTDSVNVSDSVSKTIDLCQNILVRQ